MDLGGKVALVTGAANGIGAATATALAAAGAAVLVADVDEAGGRAVADAVGGRFVALDVTAPDAWAALVGGLDRLDVVHLNAGVMTRPRSAPFLDDVVPWLTPEGYHKVMSVNVEGVVLGTMACLPALEASGGDVVVTASVAGLLAQPEDPYYSMSKHAVLGWVRGMGAVLARRGVRIQAVCPGGIDTAIVPSDLRERVGASSFSPPAYLAGAVVHALAEGAAGDVWIAYAQGQDYWRYEYAPVRSGRPS
jgi:NAD(P)-dependent dehydrogenase (short-subunit alcohol dehydrogenase family)